jgi:hypothetical protein
MPAKVVIIKMGCCASFSIEHEAENLILDSKPENTANVSFADLSIRSDCEDQPVFLNTEELNFTRSSRLRSTSCNSLRYSNQLESAFLMSGPLKSDRIISKSVNLKNCETLLEVNCFAYSPNETSRL